MPVHINTIRNGEGIEFISSGIVTGQEIIEANKRIYTREVLLGLKYKIIDRTTCTEYRVDSEEIRQIAEQDRQAARINPNISVILISTTPLQFGMSRMWQLLTDEIGFRTRIVRDRAEAESWLKANIAGYGDRENAPAGEKRN